MAQPTGWERLLYHQRQATRWLASRDAGLLALSPGLGKSAVAIMAMQARQFQSIVIVAPPTLHDTWRDELWNWWPEQAHSQCPPIALVSYEHLRLHGLPIEKPDLLLFDESVLLKNRKAVRSLAARRYRREAGACWMLSGSPTTRFHDDLWSQLNILDYKHWRSYWRFAHTYCLSERTIWGETIVANVPHAEQRLQQDAKDLLYTYSYKDLARDNPQAAIPEWTFETQDVPLPAAWWKHYKSMQTKFLAELESGQKITAANGLARLTRLLQMATDPALAALGEDAKWKVPLQGKCKVAVELAESLPQPLIVWTAFKRTMQILFAHLGGAMLSGDTPVAERNEIVTGFQDGQLPILIAHPGVGRFGLTLTRARSAVYVERSYEADFYYQSLHRIRRIGTNEPPVIKLLRASGPNGERSVDHLIDATLSYRKDASIKLTTALVRDILD